MKPIQTFRVIPSLPPELAALRELAFNLYWCWTPDAIELFRRLDRDLWEQTGHNPVKLLGSISQGKLEEAARNDAFLDHLTRVSEQLRTYLAHSHSWFQRTCNGRADRCSVAYFSAEFGLTECLSIFAGGLGMLAGDHLKSASDLGVPLTAVGLLYQMGYFRQYLNQAGWQQEAYEANDFHNLPVQLALDGQGHEITIDVDLAGRKVYARIWRAQVGRIPLYLLDTNIDANPRPEDRDLTDQLYGGDRDLRIRQEILLGIGGCRALDALGIEPTVFHMNEGHSAFLALERTRKLMEKHLLDFHSAMALASAGMVFTTHTPVEAGHDYFTPDQVDRYFDLYIGRLGISRDEFLSLGRSQPGQGDFCMTVLALRFASRANGVSKLHGEVSRAMWARLWPGVPVKEVPITQITNGVHFPSWTSMEIKRLYDRYLGPDWHEEPANGDVWRQVLSIPSEELWRTHELRRERLVSWARRRVRDQRILRGAPQSEVDAAAEILDPDALTIGFARRFATYKRATMIFHDLPRLKRILLDAARPVQIIFAGKAHPKDDAGKELIRRVTELSRDPELGRRVVFIEDYDMAVARYLVQGVDVWLNTPARPNEASGTSGMKAAANGALNLSTLDGWWDEVWNDPANPRTIGWAIGKGEVYSDRAYQDQIEAAALYDLLERDVVPKFYTRGSDRIPRQWVDRMKASIAALCHFVNTHRMVSDYTREFYIPTHEHFRALEAGGGQRAREIAASLTRIRREWPAVRILKVEHRSQETLGVGDRAKVAALVQFGNLPVESLLVELYLGPLDENGEIRNGTVIPMIASRHEVNTQTWFECDPPCGASGMHGYTVRVRPRSPDGGFSFVSGILTWAASCAAAGA